MTEGVECLCPRCGYEHTTSEVKERIVSAKREESARHTPKRAPPKPAFGHPASPYVDPFSSASGKMGKGSSAKAAVLYGVAIALGIAIILLLAVRISRFVSSPRKSSGPLVTKSDSKPVRKAPLGVPSATKPVPSERPAPSTTVSYVQMPLSVHEPLPQEKTTPRWEHPKNWYERECANAEKMLENFQSGGYRMTDRSVSASSVRGRIAAVRRCVSQNDPAGTQLAYENLLSDVKRYSAHCVWTKGLRHPKYAHIFSGQNPGVWEIEKGYQLVNPGTTDWTVRKIPVEVVCGRCRGNRYISERGRCPTCNGKKVFTVESVYPALGRSFPSRGRGGRTLPRPPSIKTPCWNCGGTGSVPVQRECPRCKGRGTELR